MNSIQQALEFYKSIGRNIFKNISLSNLIWKFSLGIIILVLINSFPEITNNIIGPLEDIIKMVLFIDIFLIIGKTLHSLYIYKKRIFATIEEKNIYKKNQFNHIKQSIYGLLKIRLGWFIITFVFFSIDIILGGAIPAINLFWVGFIALTLFTIMCLDANIIIFYNIFNKYKKAYLINYVLMPLIFIIMIIVYLNILY